MLLGVEFAGRVRGHVQHRRRREPLDQSLRQLSIVNFRSTTFECQLSIVYFRLSTFDHQLSIINFRSSTFGHPLLIVNFRSSTLDLTRNAGPAPAQHREVWKGLSRSILSKVIRPNPGANVKPQRCSARIARPTSTSDCQLSAVNFRSTINFRLKTFDATRNA